MTSGGYRLIVAGASTGGLHALGTILGALPEDFPLPIAVAQHRGRNAHDALPELLSRASALPVAEVEDKEPIRPGRVYLAPADYHLLVERGRFCLSLEAPVRHARPSIDVLFETAAEAYADAVVGVLLTGSNEDGAAGLERIRARGGRTIAQDPATAERGEMPQAAITAGVIDRILAVEAIGPYLAALANPAAAGARP